MNREEIIAFLKENVRPKRVKHSLGTEKAARELAERFGCDPAKAALAGLAHDCAKGLAPELMQRYAEEAGFAVDELCRCSPQILHAPAGATLARMKLGITDQEVLSAICWHTVPRLRMATLEKVVSVADLIEETRDFEGVEAIRMAAKTDLDKAFRLSLARVIIHVLENGLPVHPDTITVYNELTLRQLPS